CIAFVDYEKAFDSVQTQAVLTSLQEQGIEDVYVELLKHMYTNSSMTVHLHKECNKINIRRGVRHGETISPKLFTATLERIFRKTNLGNQRLEDRWRILQPSSLRRRHTHMRKYTALTTTNAAGTSR
ncbi:MAG: reverse transcriptase domain-containing protein, partial [Chromatiales bacterium]